MKIMYSETYNALNSLQEIMALVHNTELDSRLTIAVRQQREIKRGYRNGAFEWLNYASCGIQDQWCDKERYEFNKYQTLKNAKRLKDAMLSGNFNKLIRIKPLMELVELIQEQKESVV